LTESKKSNRPATKYERGYALGKDMPELVVYPLYLALPPQAQRQIFTKALVHVYLEAPAGRKVIVSTNIAETS
jgi:pre-mRNA-splicing factor ATP-dependent RNA helicase DHX15/PRP43